MAFDFYSITVYKDVVAYRGGTSNDMGYVEISKCEWNGMTSSALMYARVDNNSGAQISAFYEFAYWVVRLDVDGEEDGELYTAVLPVPVPVPVASGSSDRAFYADSHTVKAGDGDPGESAELGVKITLDVWQGGARIDIWTAPATAYYDFPQN